MSVIGPNGKDLYAVALVFQGIESANDLIVKAILVEAISKEEAVGKGWAVANKIAGDRENGFGCARFVDASLSEIITAEYAFYKPRTNHD